MSNSNHEKPAAQVIIDDLREQVTSDEDRKILGGWQEELNEKRQAIEKERQAIEEARTKEVGKLVILSDGSAVPERELQGVEGDPNLPYGNGRR